MTVVENEYRVIGPPGCLAEGSLVFTNFGHIKIERLNDEEYLDALALSDNGRGGYEFLPIVGFKNSGVRPTVCIETEFGHELFLTADHDVFTKNGKVRADRLFHGENFVHTTDGWAAIVSVTQGEECKTYDITVGHPSGSGNYFANGILVSNCGKTTYLSTQVAQRVERWCADTGLEPRQCQDVIVSSLTKAAAGEVLSRGLSLPDEQVGTLHAHALHALGNPKLCVGPKQISEWNKQAKMDHWIKGGSVNREEDGYSLDVGQFRGDELMNEYTINRCRMTPRETWRADVVEFADAFEKWKFMNSYMDYTDLIEGCLKHKVAPPGNPSTILVDEVQDEGRLELSLIRYWASRVNKLIIVGDPDQCQPGDTIIDLAGGSRKRLDEIDPLFDKLTCYDRHSAKLVGMRDGLKFKKAVRKYTGRLATVELANGKSTRCTHDHRWLAKWAVRSDKSHVVYMMHRGDRWRVGWCKLWGKSGLHLGTRCRLEDADGGWILKTFENSRDAAVYEKIVSIKYGMPLICFNPREGVEYVDEVFEALDPGNQALKATLCLSEHGRDYRHPFWSKAERHEKQGHRAPLILRTCNLLPEYMHLPHRVKQDESEAEWQPFKLTHKFVRDEEVFSLDVEKHHNYVANGIVTMNNLYEWRGTDPGGFYESEIPEGHTKVLEQSYRVPRAVHKVAMQMIERCGTNRKPVVYHPRDEQGEVSFAPYSLRMDPVEAVREIERLLDEPDSKPGQAKVMLLFSCAYMTQPITTALRDAGIPFWNPYSRERSNFNPLHPAKGVSTLDRILRYLKPNQQANGDGAKMWTWSDFYEWSDMCNAEGWLRHGQKAEIKRRAASTPHQEMSVEDIEGVLSSPAILAELEEVDLGFLAPRIADAKLGVYNYVVDIQRKRGYNSLSSNPRVVVGTIHSVKGAEADHVILSPDLSSSGWEVYGSKHIDSLHRLFYVGLTRAYRRLVLCQASSPRAIQW